MTSVVTWQPVYPIFLYAVFALAGVAVLATARRMAISPRLGTWMVLGPRLLVLGLLILVLLNPIERRETHLPPRPAAVAVLVDCSKSMLLGEPQSRLEQVKQTIQQATASIPVADRPRVQLFRFGEHLAKVPSLVELHSIDEASQLGPALERLPSRMESDQPRAVFVVSDGALEDSERLTELTDAYREMSLPIHTLIAGDNGLRGDVAIAELAVPPRVTSGDKATLRTVVSSRGFAGQRVVLAVHAAGRESAPPLATLPITLTDGRQPCELVVDVDADVGAMTLSLPVLPGEATRENNVVPFRLAQRDRRLKVLYMEGTQGAEYRWLRDALQEDTDIRCVSMTVNDQYASRPTLQRVEDPYRGFPATRDELFEFDVVICSDISQQAFTQEQIDWTVDLVANRGGGFVMVGGHTSFGSGGWDRTAWEQLIPFDMSGQRQYVGNTFHVVVSAEAESHPIWQLLDDPAQNRQALDRMPAFLGTNLIARVKPAATLLGETDQSLPQIGDVMPVFAAQPFGRGRTFAMSTDTTVYWGRDFESQWGEGDNRYFRKFWRNVVRWLAENSLSADRRLHVQTDKVIYTPGEPMQVAVEAYDEALQPTTEYRVTARLISAETDSASTDMNEPAEATLPTAFSTTLVASDSPPRYVGELPARLPADQRDAARISQPVELLVTAYDGDQQIAAKTVSLHLLHDSKEWLNPQSRPEVLDEIAAASGGRRLSGPREFTNLLGSFDPTPGEVLYHNVPLWDSPLLWTLLVMLLAMEWILRRTSQFHRGETVVTQT